MEPTRFGAAAGRHDLDVAAERIHRSADVRFIDAGERDARLAALGRVRTVGEVLGVVGDLPELDALRGAAPRSAHPAPTSGPPGPRPPAGAQPPVLPVPMPAAMPVPVPAAMPVPVPAAMPPRPPGPLRRLPITSPGREDAPPPTVPYGPYGDRYAGTDPRALSLRLVTQVVPTAWGPTWQVTVVRQTNRYAMWSLILGCIGVFCGGAAPAGIIAGHAGLVQIRRSENALAVGTVVAVGEQPQEGRGLAIAGLIVSYLVTAAWLALIVWLIVVALQNS